MLIVFVKVSGFGCQVSGKSLIAHSQEAISWKARKLYVMKLVSFQASQLPSLPAILLTPEH